MPIIGYCKTQAYFVTIFTRGDDMEKIGKVHLCLVKGDYAKIGDHIEIFVSPQNRSNRVRIVVKAPVSIQIKRIQNPNPNKEIILCPTHQTRPHISKP